MYFACVSFHAQKQQVSVTCVETWETLDLTGKKTGIARETGKTEKSSKIKIRRQILFVNLPGEPKKTGKFDQKGKTGKAGCLRVSMGR
jgi:hypothetical protein